MASVTDHTEMGNTLDDPDGMADAATWLTPAIADW
jgi:hypothetical protein